MKKLQVREVYTPRSDPRAEPDVTRAPKSAADLMAALRASRPPIEQAPGPTDHEDRRDVFGIVGTTIGRLFRVEACVGHGGFSVVYRAAHLRFGAPAALKCLKLAGTLSPIERREFFEKFKAEGELMFRLSGTSPEIVRPIHIDSFHDLDGHIVPYIALEWLDGETLKQRIIRRLEEDKPPLSLASAVALLTPVARALSRAHSFPGPEGRLAILHCDVKPDNIFLAKQEGEEVVKVFDFGIAKVRDAATREAGGATVAARNMFTPAYAAPEQWSPDKFGQTGPWTDVFGLALTLAEVVSQRPAFNAEHPSAYLLLCMNPRERPTPRRLGVDVSDEVDAVFARALAVDPKQRIASVEELWNELEDAVGLPRSLSASGRASLAAVTTAVDWDEPRERVSSPEIPAFREANTRSDAPTSLRASRPPGPIEAPAVGAEPAATAAPSSGPPPSSAPRPATAPSPRPSALRPVLVAWFLAALLTGLLAVLVPAFSLELPIPLGYVAAVAVAAAALFTAYQLGASKSR